jgi:hypothetical protein
VAQDAAKEAPMKLDWSEQSPHIRTLFHPWQPGDGYDEATLQMAEARLGVRRVLAQQMNTGYVMYSVRLYRPLLNPIETMTDHREVDNVFVKRLFEHLTESRDYDHYRDYVTTEIQAHEQKRSHIDIQLQAIAEQMAGIEATLELPPSKLSKERREKFAEKLAQLEARQTELKKEKELPKALVVSPV